MSTLTARYGNLDGRYEQLAFHAERAGEIRAALGYLWQAGLEARRNSAAASLNLIFDRALALIDRIGEAGRGPVCRLRANEPSPRRCNSANSRR